MRILQINPIEVNSYVRNCDNINGNSILVGKWKDDAYYLSDLYFPPVLIKHTEIFVKAVLKMYCKKICGSNDSITVYINNNNVSADIQSEGFYEWDVTELLKSCGKHNFKLCAYAKKCIGHCNIKEFEAVDINTMPVLEVFVGDAKPNPDNKVVNIVNEYASTLSLRHTDWIDVMSLNKYYYFVKNFGNSDVGIIVEISPDKKIVYQDSELFTINASEVIYLQPMRNSQYVRLSYKNLSSNCYNLIKVWFQGKL
ncbi:MAG: DUF6385 domain-containing protein [Sedimentibacter sp.]